MPINVQGKTSLHIVTIDDVQSQWYLGLETMDPIKLCMKSDTLRVILLGVSVYQGQYMDFHVFYTLQARKIGRSSCH